MHIIFFKVVFSGLAQSYFSYIPGLSEENHIETVRGCTGASKQKGLTQKSTYLMMVDFKKVCCGGTMGVMLALRATVPGGNNVCTVLDLTYFKNKLFFKFVMRKNIFLMSF